MESLSWFIGIGDLFQVKEEDYSSRIWDSNFSLHLSFIIDKKIYTTFILDIINEAQVITYHFILETNANVIVGKVVPIILKLPYAGERYYNLLFLLPPSLYFFSLLL